MAGAEDNRSALRFAPWLAFVVVVVAALFLGLRIGGRSVDFPVYYRTVHSWRAHGPIYGPHSGLGWPMYYRYPPVFLLLFFPLALLPLAWAAAIWLAGKVAVLLLLGRAFARRFGWPRLAQFAATWRGPERNGPPMPAKEFPSGNSASKEFPLGNSAFNEAGPQPRPQSEARPAASRNRAAQPSLLPWLPALLLLAPYLVLEFRYGNVQFYVVALCVAALLVVPRRPRCAGALLGLGIAVKVWPLFFVPYWLAARRWRAAAAAVIAAVLLTAAPALVFGWSGNFALLHAWAAQERETALHAGTIWYASQSLRGVMTRALPLGAALVTRLWLPLDLAAYVAFLFYAKASLRRGAALETVGAAFCLLAILAPFTHVKDLVLFVWPAVAVAVLVARPAEKGSALARGLCWAAAILAGVIPLVPGAAAQHRLQLAGADFVVLCLLAAGLLLAMRRGSATPPHASCGAD
ncbi:MAG: glycosyltransferase family 87 protein [Terriglobales bacterium]